MDKGLINLLDNLRTGLNKAMHGLDKDALDKGNIQFNINNSPVHVDQVLAKDNLVVDEIVICPLVGIYDINFREKNN